jgi:hypothetical protein
MKAFDVVLAILRDWPGADERLDRLARMHGMFPYKEPKFVNGEWVDVLIDPRKRNADRWVAIVDNYFHKWASAFMNEELGRLTNEELSIRLAIAERVLTETRDVIDELPQAGETNFGPVRTPFLDAARREYERVAHEIARRDTR